MTKRKKQENIDTSDEHVDSERRRFKRDAKAMTEWLQNNIRSERCGAGDCESLSEYNIICADGWMGYFCKEHIVLDSEDDARDVGDFIQGSSRDKETVQ